MRISDKEMRDRQAEREREERALINDLQSAGFNVKSAWEFVNWKGQPYRAAIPVLLKHLRVVYSDRVREGIARSLGRRFARQLAWDAVLEMYESEPSLEQAWFKDGLAVALSCMALPSDLSKLIELVDNKRHGATRVFFISNLSRSKNPAGLAALARNKNDPDLSIEIEAALKRKASHINNVNRVTKRMH